MLIAGLTVLMGAAQVMIVILVLHDLDPAAKPVTTLQTIPPYAQHLKATWTVNAMKWIMMTLLCVGMTSEAAQCETTFRTAMKVSNWQLNVSRSLPIAMCIAQYL